MKSKGITVWELHVEKIVLGLACVAFVAFTAMQFVGNPNAAKIGNEVVSPGQVDSVLEEKAKQISVQLSPDAPSTLTLPEVKPVADQLAAALDQSLSPMLALNVPRYYDVPKAIEGTIVAQTYSVPDIIASAPITPKQYSDAIVPEVVEANSELMSLFSSGKPYDLTYVTVYGEVPWAKIVDQFQKTEPDKAQIPATWYQGAPGIIDVVVERGELVGGEITNIITLDPIPDQYSFRKDFLESAKPLTTKDRNYILEQIRRPEVEREISQPEFYATRRNSWQPLLIGEAAQDDVSVDPDDPVLRLDRLIRSKKAERDRIDKQLTELGGPLEGDDAKPAGGDKPGSGGSVGGGSGGKPGKGGGNQFGAPTGGNTSLDDAAKKRIRTRRIALTRKLAALDAQLAKLGDERSQLAGSTQIEAVADDAPKDKIMVWGHDINVEPGKDYVYRITIKVFNPFFGRKMSLVEDQWPLADSIALSSPASEWSKPIHVDPPVRVFATSATAASQNNMPGAMSTFGQASFEVFRFYDGLMWSETFSVQPGDRIGAVRDVTLRGGADGTKKFSIDFRTDWLVVDIIENHEADTRGAGPSGGMDARVVLMNMKTGEVVEQLRDPNTDRFSVGRQELKQEVQLSEAAAVGS